MTKEMTKPQAPMYPSDMVESEGQNNALVITEDTPTNVSIDVFTNPDKSFLTSFTDDGSRESKIKIYNAISNAENSLSDHIGEVLEIEHMVAHPIELADEVTGKMVQAMRVVLVDVNGVGYHAVSNGVVSSLQKIIGIVGPAPWTPALQVVPKQVKTRGNGGMNKATTLVLK